MTNCYHDVKLDSIQGKSFLHLYLCSVAEGGEPRMVMTDRKNTPLAKRIIMSCVISWEQIVILGCVLDNQQTSSKYFRESLKQNMFMFCMKLISLFWHPLKKWNKYTILIIHLISKRWTVCSVSNCPYMNMRSVNHMNTSKVIWNPTHHQLQSVFIRPRCPWVRSMRPVLSNKLSE